MCNIFKKDQLFKVRNPCCCCSLRCGTLWICIFSFWFGFCSLFLPDQLGIQHDFKNATASTKSAMAAVAEDKYSWMDEIIPRFTIHYGCFLIQMATALCLAMTDVFKCGGLINFISGTVWIIGRLVVTGFWVPLMYRILSIASRIEDNHKWKRYGYFLATNVTIHFYFLAVVRYYTMEAWDMWSYRPRTPDFRHPLNRHIPMSIKPSTGTHRFHKKPKKTDNLTEWRQRRLFHDAVDPEARDYNEWILESGLPTWHLGKDYIIRGEDYSGFDPIRHYQGFQKIVETGVLDWNEDDFMDEEKLEEVRHKLMNPSNVVPIPSKSAFMSAVKTNLDNNDSPDERNALRPTLAGFYSGHIQVKGPNSKLRLSQLALEQRKSMVEAARKRKSEIAARRALDETTQTMADPAHRKSKITFEVETDKTPRASLGSKSEDMKN